MQGKRKYKQRKGQFFIDGNLNAPGCVCTISCEFPCWQRIGLTGPCETCHCGVGVLESSASLVTERHKLDAVILRLRETSAEARRFLRGLGVKNV